MTNMEPALRLELRTCLFFLHLSPATVIYTLSLHDALPILKKRPACSELRWAYCNHKATYFATRSSLRSEERFSRNAETDLVCRLLLEKKKASGRTCSNSAAWRSDAQRVSLTLRRKESPYFS